MNKKENILEFWKLCEIIDFERFYLSKEKIETISTKIENQINTKYLNNEFAYKKLTNLNTDIKFKTTNIYKIYYGLIKSEALIKYIYSVLKGNDEISNNEAIERELEKLKSNDYTYLASGFTNSNFFPISIDGEVISVNQIFFVLHQIINNKSFNNEEFIQFQENINSLFYKKLNLDNSIHTDIYIPDLKYLLNLVKYAKNSKTIFDFLPLEVETSICLIDKKYLTTLENLSDDSAKIVLENIKSLLDREDNNTLFLYEFGDELSILDHAVLVANSKKYANIHLITKDKIDKNHHSIKIPLNLFLYTFIKKDEFRLNKTVTSTKPLDTDKANAVFQGLIKILDLKTEVFYLNNNNYCFAKMIENQQINNIENILNLNMTSFFIEALKEKPKKLTHKYIQGEKKRLDINSNIDIRKDINKLEYFSNIKAKWISLHPLYYAQQNAVNIFISNLNKKRKNLLSINGAPGTGKTTLLKDIIANIITKKILDCKQLNFEIFTSNGFLNSKLCSKYEIVVTSNNNAAVENITRELPQQKEIDFEYLNFQAEDFLLYKAAQKFYNKNNCYTLITTILGNSENINNFKTNFENMIKYLELNPIEPTILNNKQNKLNNRLDFLLKEIEKEEETFKRQIQLQNALTKKTGDEKENINYNLADDNFFSKNEKELQLSSLYAKESYLKLKAEVFKISLQLNEILFLKNIENFSKQILFYINNITKTNLSNQELKKFKNGFSCLSFVFPAVSTSLASSYKMFKNINSYGVLLCDEAGQATPQSLVGLLNRTNNALIVGDPLQVEPVFTAPEVLVKILAEQYKIDKIYSPLTSSAQQVADNANCYGSYYKINNENIWVGMPLVVHRRCVEPMFSISNEISYNNKMVLATPPLKDNDETSYLPISSWIHIESNNTDFIENTSIKELKALNEFVSKYKIKSYYLISPFKSIYKVVETRDDSVGTVHTFQGKETDVVFLLLGGNTATNSKSWVSSKPNILNVAVTRAKKRIYIIGDKNIWKKHNYFKNAIEILDN